MLLYTSTHWLDNDQHIFFPFNWSLQTTNNKRSIVALTFLSLTQLCRFISQSPVLLHKDICQKCRSKVRKMDNSDKISLHIIGAKTLSYHGLLHLSTAFGFPTSFLLVGNQTKGGVLGVEMLN